MSAPAPMILPRTAEEVLAKLTDAGYEAYLVGGSTRDALRGVSPHDYDITTNATPKETEAVFRTYRVIETGVKHGTVTVMVDREPYEITTYRVDGDYRDHRHPKEVTFTRSLREDLARRDFTMNAVAYSPGEGYVDPFGGIPDIAAGVIRCVGVAKERFTEDALRILRALRFASVLGYTIEEETARAARDCRDLIRHVSRERIREELLKLLAGDFSADVLRNYPDILGVCLPDILPMVDCPQNTPYHLFSVWEHTIRVVAGLPKDPILRFAGLYHDVAKPACRKTDKKGQDHFFGHPAAGADITDRAMRELKFDNKSRERAVLLVRIHDQRFAPSEARILRLLSEIGYENFLLWNDLQKADNDAHNPAHPVIQEGRRQIAKIREIGEQLEAAGACYKIADLRVGGEDILKTTPFRGAAVKKTLQALLEAVMEGKVENSREALLSFLQERILPSTPAD